MKIYYVQSPAGVKMVYSNRRFLKEVYARLFKQFGPQYWWPGETKIEIIVGAILTQNTNWLNVEKALTNLKQFSLLSVASLNKIPQERLAELIKPAGYFNVKAKRVKSFIKFLYTEFDGNLSKMGELALSVLRPRLLSVHGIGPETADSILLYAFNKPVFVIDAYTKRFLYRHNIAGLDADYHFLQNVVMRALEHDTVMFNEYHALIVSLGKQFCRTKPRCELCPLNAVNYSVELRCEVCFRYLPGENKRKNKLIKKRSESKRRICGKCLV